MDYKKLENNWLLVPSEMTPTKEFWRVMGKHSRQIVCVDKIDPDVTLHPTGIPWDVDGVHKGLPFVKGAGINSLDEVTKKEREVMEIAKTANEKRPEKQAKRKERDEEQERVDEFYATPVGERQVIHDTKIRWVETTEEVVREVTEENPATEEEIAEVKEKAPTKKPKAKKKARRK